MGTKGGEKVETVQIDIDRLADYVQGKMDEEGLSLRQVARQARISAATLSRILQKGKKRPRPEVDTLVKVIRWVGVPIENIIDTGLPQRGDSNLEKSTPETIAVHLRADRNLSPEAAQAIAKMVKVAYEQFVSQRRGAA